MALKPPLPLQHNATLIIQVIKPLPSDIIVHILGLPTSPCSRMSLLVHHPQVEVTCQYQRPARCPHPRLLPKVPDNTSAQLHGVTGKGDLPGVVMDLVLTSFMATLIMESAEQVLSPKTS